MVKYLFTAARELFGREDCWGRTPLLEASRTGHEAVVAFLSVLESEAS